MGPSQRRLKLLGLVVILLVLTVLYFTSAARSTRNSPFYTKTQAALEQKAAEAEDAAAAAAKAKTQTIPAGVDSSNNDKDVKERLKDAEVAAKQAAQNKGEKAQEVVADTAKDGAPSEKSVAGRILMEDGVAKVGNKGPQQTGLSDGKKPLSKEDHEVEVELNAILKKSPIIIFSKTFCPYSRKAKHILLDLYKITPAPYVVELNEHPLGPQLQAHLGESTRRTTVPNILINGKSIGGGDEIGSLHESNKIIETVKTMGGKRIMEVSPVEQDSAAHEVKR